MVSVENSVSDIKVPPHSIEAEQSVLGGLLLDNQAWDKIIEIVQSSDFYLQQHQVIFNAISTILNSNQPLDVLTLTENLRENKKLETSGGDVYLFELARNTPSAANVVAYANIVRERSVLRQLIFVGGQIAESAFNPEGRNSHLLLDDAERRVFAIAETNARAGGPIKISTHVGKALDRIRYLAEHGDAITGLPTGYHDLDEMTSGLQPSDLIIIAGRPSMGKTGLAMNIAEYAVLNTRKPVLVFSMEMPGEALAVRLLSSLARIDQHSMRTGKLTDNDWPRISSALHLLSEAPLFIDDTPALSPGELRARARRLARQHGELGLIVIDYLQLMQTPGFRENRTAEISEVSRSLKALAKELNVPVMALSQLNRSLEQRTDRRPVMSDLRESGAIEQDADVIAFIYRDEVYNENSPNKGTAEIIIAKQRNGPIGKVYLSFLGKYTRFENAARGSFNHVHES